MTATLLAIVALIASSAALAAEAARGDLSNPKSAVQAYFEALVANDTTAAKAAAAPEAAVQQLVESDVRNHAAWQQYRDAARARFGADQVPPLDMAKSILKLLANATVAVDGETARVEAKGENGSGSWYAKKIDDHWVIVLEEIYGNDLQKATKYLDKVSEALNRFTSTIPGGNWKTFKEMNRELNKSLPAGPG